MAIPEVICVDFGTSSIRAAVRTSSRGNAIALELGEATRSSIDRASIPSAIFIPADESIVCFGEEALQRGLRGEAAALFETSPKKWMTESTPSALEDNAVSSLGLSKEALLAGLFAQAWSALGITLKEHPRNLASTEVRISHPVWISEDEDQLGSYLYYILDHGLQMAGDTDRPRLIDDFGRLSVRDPAVHIAHEIDVVEPVAATLEAYRNTTNTREACMVVDVGAGTTDMALYISVTPDDGGRVSRKFIPLANALSVFKAGDVIDRAVIDVIHAKAGRLTSVAKADIDRRRRGIKEDLFTNGTTVIHGVEISLGDVEGHELIRGMRAEISHAASNLLRQAKPTLKEFTHASMHRIDQIDIVFVGGGANIDFLRKAVKRGAGEADVGVPPVFRKDGAEDAGSLPASFERLAVALGGTTRADGWPETRMKEPPPRHGPLA